MNNSFESEKDRIIHLNRFKEKKIKDHFERHNNNEYFELENNHNVIFCWKKRKCISHPNVEQLMNSIRKFLHLDEDTYNDISYIVSELIINAFRSKAEYKLRAKDGDYCYIKNENGIMVNKNCQCCIETCFEILNFDNHYFIIVRSYNKIYKESIDRIHNALKSDDVHEFDNEFSTSYTSITGSTGIGLYSINKLLKDNYNSELKFIYNDESVNFFFEIEKNGLEKAAN